MKETRPDGTVLEFNWNNRTARITSSDGKTVSTYTDLRGEPLNLDLPAGYKALTTWTTSSGQTYYVRAHLEQITIYGAGGQASKTMIYDQKGLHKQTVEYNYKNGIRDYTVHYEIIRTAAGFLQAIFTGSLPQRQTAITYYYPNGKKKSVLHYNYDSKGNRTSWTEWF